MHRSGTSCLVGTLEAAGLYLGEVSRQNAFNEKGNRESPRIMALHDEVMRANGGSWDRPPHAITWSPEHLRTRDEIIRSYVQAAECWGFKDPRTLFTLDQWLVALPSLRKVGIFRHPIAVARSLQRRNGFDITRGIELWTLYNQRMLDYHDAGPFPMISFDAEADRLMESLARLAQRLGLRDSVGSIFFEERLRHHRGDDGALPAAVQRLYAQLLERAD
jgi:hypothetical protein